MVNHQCLITQAICLSLFLLRARYVARILLPSTNNEVQIGGRFCWTLSAFLSTQKSAQKSKTTQKSALESKSTLLSAQKSAQTSGFAQKSAQMSSFTQKRAQMSKPLKKVLK